MDNAVKLTSALIRNGWSLNVMHEEDTGGNPFISIEAVKQPNHVRAVWHTRDNNGKYRLQSCVVNQAESTLTKTLEYVKQSGEPIAA